MAPTSGTPWEDASAESAGESRFDRGRRFDLVVIGAGYTGLSTALHAAERGLSVQVIEAGRIGEGGSGRNVGYVNAGVWLPPGKVLKAMGQQQGAKSLRVFADAPRTVFGLIEKHQIRCAVTRTGTIHAAHSAAGLAGLRERHAVWQEMREPVDLLSDAEMARMTGTTAFPGGLLDHRAGTLNPMAYCRGLARAARAAGADIAAGVRATKIAQDGGWVVETDHGAVRAGAVVIATNAYANALWPGLEKTFTPIHFLQLATEPMGDRATGVLPGGQGLWDTGTVMLSLRKDAEGRLILGTMGRVVGGVTERWAARTLARLFPDLGPVRFESAWDGRIGMTPDHLPRIHKLADGVWAALGYNGRGITTGTVFGQALAGLVAGDTQADLPLPPTTPRPVFGRAVKAGAMDLALTANQIWGGIRPR